MDHFNKGRRYTTRGKVPEELGQASVKQIAWAAGLFEGEGSIMVERKRGGLREYATPRMSLNSTDEDVVMTLRSILGGRVNFEPQKAANRKDQWKWTLSGWEAVNAVFALIGPWLHRRRNERFLEVLADVKRVRDSV